MSVLPAREHADQQQLRLILTALRDGVILFEPDQRISWANEAALRMHGVGDITGLGASVSEYRERFELRYRNRRRLPEGDCRPPAPEVLLTPRVPSPAGRPPSGLGPAIPMRH